MYKKHLLSLFLSAIAILGYAQDNVTISNFTLKAGVPQTEENVATQTADVILNNSKEYGGMQFYLTLPKGVSIYSDVTGFWYDIKNRLKWKEGREEKTFSVTIKEQSDGSYFFFIYNDKDKTIAGNSGDPILTLYLTISDPEAYETGTKQCVITDLRIAVVGGNPDEAAKSDQVTSDCTLRVMAKTAASGYGSFSWPHDLDFTNAGVEAYVAEKDENLIVSLNPVTLVPANTGIVIKGEPSTEYYPETTDNGGTATSILTGTAAGAYTVASDDVYAIATINGKTAFYQVNQGVAVPQYKAYLTHTAAAGAAPYSLEADFSTVNGIAVVDQQNASDDTFHTIDGIKVAHPTQRGIYIQNGKKVVIK